MFMLGFPLLLIPFAIYNIIAFLMPGVSWTGTIATVRMVSDADWTMSAGDILVAFAIVLLCGEIIKSTRIGIFWIGERGLAGDEDGRLDLLVAEPPRGIERDDGQRGEQLCRGGDRDDERSRAMFEERDEQLVRLA